MVHWYTTRNFPPEIADQNAMYWALGTVLIFLVIGLVFLTVTSLVYALFIAGL
mgnify:CR=1 FL=1